MGALMTWYQGISWAGCDAVIKCIIDGDLDGTATEHSAYEFLPADVNAHGAANVVDLLLAREQMRR